MSAFFKLSIPSGTKNFPVTSVFRPVPESRDSHCGRASNSAYSFGNPREYAHAYKMWWFRASEPQRRVNRRFATLRSARLLKTYLNPTKHFRRHYEGKEHRAEQPTPQMTPVDPWRHR
eukprot:1117218_1